VSLTSPQQVGNLRESYGETCLIDFEHYLEIQTYYGLRQPRKVQLGIVGGVCTGQIPFLSLTNSVKPLNVFVDNITFTDLYLVHSSELEFLQNYKILN